MGTFCQTEKFTMTKLFSSVMSLVHVHVRVQSAETIAIAEGRTSFLV